ncbi:hypothetical protein PRSY57_1014200 [Plasmodium reichenowi]|uniref:EF-hand domain-containing protein n=1 Tax=Plasmodium reichenowi TaxID=5854 RepID=A0A151LF70_PLARE|nr:hypothetical protein PRSY57_1014200 [Plasmodium reichenowi]KYN97598.1 hypothetical protein PRSY57_1014200 [Plasmodium reichenowi]
MDEKIELLINIIKKWTNKYAYKIYIKGMNEEKQEHYYNVTFFNQKEKESTSNCTINTYFVITEIKLIDIKNFCTSIQNENKYYVTFNFENENLMRTTDMNLDYEAWIDKLIKDKEKLRNNIDLSSEFMKSRFIKPLDEKSVASILDKVKEERENTEKREKEEEEEKKKNALKKKNLKYSKKENILEKKSSYEDTYAVEKINSKTDFNIDNGNTELKNGSTKNDENNKLNEARSFLKNILYFYFTDIDIKKKGKLKYNNYVEILKMVNYKMCISYKHMHKTTSIECVENDQEKRNEMEDNRNNEKIVNFHFEHFKGPFLFDSDEGIYSSTDHNSSDEYSFNDNKDIKKKQIAIKDEKKYLQNLFSINNKEIDLIKDISIYKNNNFNGSNIFFNEYNNDDIYSELFIFNNDNEYYKYVFTDNYYDLLLYISYADEDDRGCIFYNNYINSLTQYLYELKKNREEHFHIFNLNDLYLYKQLLYTCYENELSFIYQTFLVQFKKFDTSDSGYIHRNHLKFILQENDHIISRQEYKLLMHIFDCNDDNYVYYNNFKEVILRLRFEGIKNSIYEKDKKLLQKYLCEQLIKNNLKNKKKMHIFDCKNVLDFCDKLYLNKNVIHIILSSLNFDENLELDVTLFLQVSITIIMNSIKLENMQKIYNIITDEKEKKKEFQNGQSNINFKGKKDNIKIEKTNIPALELVERTLTKLFKVLDEKNEDYLKINDFIETLLEFNKKKKIIDIKAICRLNINELQGFVGEINAGQQKNAFLHENIKDSTNYELYKKKKIHYASHIHKWCSKTYQIRSCEYYSYFLNYPNELIELDDEINKKLLFCEEKKD